MKMNQFRELQTGQRENKGKILIKILIKKTLVQSQSNLTGSLQPTCKNKDKGSTAIVRSRQNKHTFLKFLLLNVS